MIVRKDYISRLEKEVDIPEELMPDKIKEMLDKKTAGPIIDGKGSAYDDAVMSRTKIRMNGVGNIIARTLSAAAVFVLLIGGAAIIKLHIDTRNETEEIEKYEETTIAVTAENDGLIGLRAGNYESLYRYMLDADENEHEAITVDGSYAFVKDSEFGETDKNEISWQFRSLVGADALYYGSPDVIPLTEDYSERAQEGNYILKPKLVQQYGDTAFTATGTNVLAYKLDAERTKTIDYDFWKDTYFKTVLGKDKEKNAAGHTLTPFVTGLYINDDKLIMTFCFNIVTSGGENASTAAYSGVCMYDISDTANISLVYEYEQPGTLRDTLLYKDNRFVMVGVYDNCKELLGYTEHETDTADYLPQIYVNGKAEPASKDNIYLANKGKADELTFVSSFGTGSDGVFCRTGSALFAGCLNNVLVDEKTVMLYSCQVTDSGVTKGHLTKLDVSEGIDVCAAGYLESGTSAPARLSSFSEANGNYFIADDMTGVFVLGSELESLGVYRFNNTDMTEVDENSPYTGGGALTLTIIDNYVTLQGDKAYVYHWNGTPARVYEQPLADQPMNTNCTCKRIIDLSDPKSPKETQIEDPADAPCIYRETQPDIYLDYGIGSIVLNGEDALAVKSSTYSLGDIIGGDTTYSSTNGQYSQNIGSILIEGRHVMFWQSKDADTRLNVCSLEPEKSYVGECSVFNMSTDEIEQDKVNMLGTEDTELFEGNVTRFTISPVEYYNSENSLVFLPGATSYEKDMFTENVQSDPAVSEEANEEICYVYAIEFDNKNGELLSLNKVPLAVSTDDGDITFNGISQILTRSFTGSACLDGNLYVFSSTGVSCVSLDDSSKLLYAETYS